MKAKVLSFLVLALLLAAPLAAQQQDDPANPPNPPNPPQEQPANPDRPADPDRQLDRDRMDLDNDVDVRTRTATDSDELPKTASPLALFALLGLGGATTATGLRVIRRRK